MNSSTSSRPTIQDVAKQTGFSIATVSRALHQEDSPNVSVKTRERVRSVANALGYQTNLMGRSLVKGRSHTISYWTQNIFSSYYMKITRQICEQAARRKYHVMINGAHDPARNFEGAGAGFGNPLASNYDGIIGCDISYTANHDAEQLVRQNVPFVGIGLNTPPNCDSVVFDIYAAGQMAVNHLVEAGATRIALMTSGISKSNNDEPRTRAYGDAMNQAGLTPYFIPLVHEGRRNAREATLAFVAEQKSLGRALPNAIFCKNDESTIGCYRALCELGIRVPDDILLIGCDGLEDMAYQACSLSTISLPVETMCELAWDLLDARLLNRDAPIQHLVLQPELIVRESSQPNMKRVPQVDNSPPERSISFPTAHSS